MTPHLSLPERVGSHGRRVAIVDPDGPVTYADLDRGARALAVTLRDAGPDLDGRRVALLCRPGRDFVTALLAGWWAGGMVVPLHPAHPDTELGWILDDADASIVVCSAELTDRARGLAGEGRRLVTVTEHAADAAAAGTLAAPRPEHPALMVHTSGTTGRPKGAVHTHGSIAAQIEGMVEAWGWEPDDRIVLVLPLHHVHGLVNVTLCPLWVGATCEAPGAFDAVDTWDRLASGEVSVFMAVPTIYRRLVAAWDVAAPGVRARWSAGAAGLRLMVSGSAALPVSLLERWREIAGHVLLERYGMTEVGMALGNTLDRRVAGHVGVPFPGVEVRVVGEDGLDVDDGSPGELLLRGPQLFAGYWNRPEATTEAFTDGWFRTGDVAVLTPEGYRLLGRASVDILKTGGEKVSALEIEEVYRTHPAVADCAVVGLDDDEWGQRVAIAIVPAPGAARGAARGAAPDPEELRRWGKERLAAAKVPTRWLVLDDLPRNAMGKVTKADVAALF
ncbi:MAG: acyl-CoA synthetase [Acidimicrobiales bacterium]|nr:acyl-CoA synthetase [Acidimicrobiales bacterium]